MEEYSGLSHLPCCQKWSHPSPLDLLSPPSAPCSRVAGILLTGSVSTPSRLIILGPVSTDVGDPSNISASLNFSLLMIFTFTFFQSPTTAFSTTSVTPPLQMWIPSHSSWTMISYISSSLIQLLPWHFLQSSLSFLSCLHPRVHILHSQSTHFAQTHFRGTCLYNNNKLREMQQSDFFILSPWAYAKIHINYVYGGSYIQVLSLYLNCSAMLLGLHSSFCLPRYTTIIAKLLQETVTLSTALNKRIVLLLHRRNGRHQRTPQPSCHQISTLRHCGRQAAL